MQTIPIWESKKHHNIETFHPVDELFAVSICNYSQEICGELKSMRNFYAFVNLPTTMLELVSTAETRTFSRQDEKLRAIKDLKMPMARFMKRILIGQAIHSLCRCSKEQNKPDCG